VIARRLLFVLFCATVTGLTAQEKLEVEGPAPATIRLGDTSRVQIRVEGRGANPRTPKLPLVPGLAMELSSPTRSSYRFFDGRTMVSRQGVQYVLTLRPQREGSFIVPSFPIWTGTREQLMPELRLDAVRDLRGEDLGWIDVTVEPRRVYVHEPIRIRVDCGIEPGLRIVQDVFQRIRYLDIEVQAPWLSKFPGGERIELPGPSGDLRRIISNRELFAAEFTAGHQRNGKRWQRYSFDRAFLPTRTGTLELSAPTLRFHVLRNSARSRGAQSENLFVYGNPVSIEVLPIPEEGRPQPYYGAVGRFTIEAALDRDTVKVGSSVKLQLTVRGQGNLEFLRLPEVDSLEGFHKLGAAEAQRDADKVVVTYDLTPLSAAIAAIPAIAWNYFDTTPGVEEFVAVETRSLPLTVLALANGETLAPLPNADIKAVTPGVDDVFDLPEFDGARQCVTEQPRWLSWFAAFGPWLAVLVALLLVTAFRRRRADVTGQRARAAVRTCRAALTAGTEPVDAFAGYLGDRLDVSAAAVIRADLSEQLEASGLTAELAAEAAAAIQRGTEARYGGGASLTATEVEDLVQRIEPQRLDRGSWCALLLLPLLFVSAIAGPLDDGDVEAGIAAYRTGDYAAADEIFARVYEQTGDRRLLRARGNCLFRLEELPQALWAYESARLGTPRDAELLANIELLRQRLEITRSHLGFVAELCELRRQLTPDERTLLLAAAMLLAALCLLIGWRRTGLRWIGGIILLPGLWLSVEILWLAPTRPPEAIALQQLAITSEPRSDLEPVATVRPGVTVQILGSTEGAFVRIAAGERSGYAQRAVIAVIR